MSRTFRRTDRCGYRRSRSWSFNNDYWYWGEIRELPTEEEVYQDLVKFFGDTYSNWRGPCGSIKRDTNRKRRASEKRQLHKAYRLTDYEDFDYNNFEDKAIQGNVEWSYI